MEENPTILVVDDDPRIGRLLRKVLQEEGYRVHTACDGKEMRQVIAEAPINLVLLDIRLPNEDGFKLVKELRTLSNIAVIMVTGKADPIDKILGLELGADDYVTKPFDSKELVARIRSVLRRSAATNAVSEELPSRTMASFAGWRLDLSAYELTAPDGSRVSLTTREFQLLSALVQHAPRVLSRDRVLEVLAGRDWTPIDRSIDVLIGKLRKKLGDDAQHPMLIKTVRGVGYQLGASVEFG